MPMLKKIYVAGHKGMVGSSIVRLLKKKGFEHIITRSHDELDLTNQSKVRGFFEAETPDEVYLCAAKVGGIHANNTLPAEFIYENLMIQANVINEAWRSGVLKLLFLGSSCIYPKFARQPIKEDELLSGKLELTNEPYALAKIAGIKLCESYNRQYDVDFRSVMPTNLYGIGDNYHPEYSHVIPGLIRRFHEAKINNLSSVVVWGSGSPRREFLFVDDMAAASLYVMNIDNKTYNANISSMNSHINVGSGIDLTIKELAIKVADTVGFTGEIQFDTNKPDGVPVKLMDSSKLNSLGWRAEVDLDHGLISTYRDFLKKNNYSKSG